MNASARDARRAWGAAWWLRAWFTALGVFFAVMAALPWSDATSFWDGWPSRLWFLVMGIAFLVSAYRPRLELREDVVVARGIVFSKRIPLMELAEARAGYHGIELRTSDGKWFTATFVGEKSNLWLFLGRESRSDNIADTLMVAARPDFVPGRHRRTRA